MNRRRFFSRVLNLITLLPAVAVAYPRPEPKPALVLLTTQIAGFQYYTGEQIWDQLRNNDKLILHRQPTNPHDDRAVEVYWQNYKLGYIPRRDNAVIAQLMDKGTLLQARITRLEDEDYPWQCIELSVYAKV